MTEKLEDQFCPCGQTVTAKERKKGARRFYAYLIAVSN